MKCNSTLHVSSFFKEVSIYSLTFLVSDDLAPWLKWAYYISPMSYGQNAVAINEFLAKRWSNVSSSFLYQ